MNTNLVLFLIKLEEQRRKNLKKNKLVLYLAFNLFNLLNFRQLEFNVLRCTLKFCSFYHLFIFIANWLIDDQTFAIRLACSTLSLSLSLSPFGSFCHVIRLSSMITIGVSIYMTICLGFRNAIEWLTRFLMFIYI